MAQAAHLRRGRAWWRLFEAFDLESGEVVAGVDGVPAGAEFFDTSVQWQSTRPAGTAVVGGGFVAPRGLHGGSFFLVKHDTFAVKIRAGLETKAEVGTYSAEDRSKINAVAIVLEDTARFGVPTLGWRTTRRIEPGERLRCHLRDVRNAKKRTAAAAALPSQPPSRRSSPSPSPPPELSLRLRQHWTEMEAVPTFAWAKAVLTIDLVHGPPLKISTKARWAYERPVGFRSPEDVLYHVYRHLDFAPSANGAVIAAKKRDGRAGGMAEPAGQLWSATEFHDWEDAAYGSVYFDHEQAIKMLDERFKAVRWTEPESSSAHRPSRNDYTFKDVVPQDLKLARGARVLQVFLNFTAAQSLTHRDNTSSLLHCVTGAKEVWLADAPAHTKLQLRYHADGGSVFLEYNPFEDADMTAEYRKHWKYVLLLPGQSLYIPKGWWHCVQSPSGSVALSIRLSPRRHFRAEVAAARAQAEAARDGSDGSNSDGSDSDGSDAGPGAKAREQALQKAREEEEVKRSREGLQRHAGAGGGDGSGYFNQPSDSEDNREDFTA